MGFVSALRSPSIINIDVLKDIGSICTGRSLLKDNPYRWEVLSAADRNMATKFAISALSSSYCKEYSVEASARKTMEKVEKRTLQLLQDELQRNTVPVDTASMLLIHHAILNPELHSKHWTDYLYQLQDNGQQAWLIMVRHPIWLMTILPSTVKYHFQSFKYDFVGDGDEINLTKVNGIVGTSRKMLYFEYLITVEAKVGPPTGSIMPSDAGSLVPNRNAKKFCTA